MMAILLFVAQAFATSLLDTTYGIVGRDVDVIEGADSAYALVAQKKWAAAADAWLVYGKQHPETEDATRLWTVSCLIRAEDYAEAVQQMQISQTADDMDLRLGLLMSWIEVETGVYSEAFRLAELYPMRAPDAEGAKLLQLRALFESQKYRKHKRLVKKFIEAGSTDAWFWFDVAQSSLEYQEPALGYFEQAVRMNDSSAVHYEGLLKQIEQSDVRAVLRYAPDAIKKFPQDPQILKLVEGYADDEQLLEAFQAAADASPEHGKIQWLTAILFDAKARYQQSSMYFRAALDAGEDHVGIYQKLVENLDVLGESQDAHAVLIEGIEKHPDNKSLVDSAVAHSDAPQNGQLMLDRFEALWGQSPQRMIANAGFRIAKKLRQWNLALQWAKREAELSPNAIAPVLHQGTALQGLKQWSDVIELYNFALVRHPDSHTILNNLAWSYTQSSATAETLSKAEELAQLAITLSDGQNAAYFDTLAEIYWMQGKTSAAQTAIQQATKLKPDNLLYQKRLQEYTD